MNISCCFISVQLFQSSRSAAVRLARKDGQLNRVAGNTISVPVVGCVLAVLLAGCVLDDGDDAKGSSARWVGQQRIADRAGKLDCVLPAQQLDSKKRSSSSSVAMPKPKASRQKTLHNYV